jgi:chemotaxis protein MotB
VSPLDTEELRKRLEFSESKRSLLKRIIAEHTVEEDTFLWSIADLMTIILICFILFYSHAINQRAPTTDESTKVKSILQAKRSSNRQELKRNVLRGESGRTQNPKPVTHHESMRRDDSLEELRREVLNTFDGSEDHSFFVRWDRRNLVLVLGERITFNVGEAELLGKFKPSLGEIAALIASKKGHRVVVSGHTDDTPISTEQYPSNWELSAARAVNVARFLIDSGVDPHRVYVQGYAEYNPLFENTSLTKKQANRRVEITLVKENDV